MDFETELNNIKFRASQADMGMLCDFIEKLESLPNQRDSIPDIFSFLASHSDKELGSPGPLVYFLEKDSDYQEELKESLQRKPTVLNLSMVNRIINDTSGSERKEWLAILEQVCEQESADSYAKSFAKEFLEHHCEES